MNANKFKGFSFTKGIWENIKDYITHNVLKKNL